MTERLILFVGVYDTLDLFTYELQREFQKLGYEVLIFDSRKMEESLGKLAQFVMQPVKAAVTFNNLGYNMELVQGKKIWDELGIPCINILMDHPFCYREALLDSPKNGIVLCVDRNHMKYVQRFYPNIATTGFLPHGGKELSGEKKTIGERTIDVLYAGNLSRSFVENIIPDLSVYTEFPAEELCEKAYRGLIAHPRKTTEQALEEQLKAAVPDCSEEQLNQWISELHFVDLYAVSYYREKTVRVLAEKGIHVTLLGAGWDNCDWVRASNVDYYGKVPAEQVVEMMQDTKIVLSTMTWFKDGTHDRVFNGMLQKAVTVSDTSGYMEEEFQSDEDMILFDLEELDTLPEKVGKLLANPDLAQEIAERGYQKAKHYHTWAARAKELKTDLLDYL